MPIIPALGQPRGERGSWADRLGLCLSTAPPFPPAAHARPRFAEQATPYIQSSYITESTTAVLFLPLASAGIWLGARIPTGWPAVYLRTSHPRAGRRPAINRLAGPGNQTLSSSCRRPAAGADHSTGILVIHRHGCSRATDSVNVHSNSPYAPPPPAKRHRRSSLFAGSRQTPQCARTHTKQARPASGQPAGASWLNTPAKRGEPPLSCLLFHSYSDSIRFVATRWLLAGLAYLPAYACKVTCHPAALPPPSLVYAMVGWV
ncbi:hypothetical protein GGS23DRAFT_481679 [Durotheca rogersii]|uniref:uncharacterized protein n=1 Tax=Durotheca rogersii TaxID=419775 RepID=UPI00222095D5|nr:uncharacterized protein GGS23DRAFT_481679 [Durotheca rogersii]KAI5864085.1 hypothetical protein GGS23DRAFT_481679 [Durotheca rogersii]